MAKILVSLYDAKSETWTNPTIADTKGSALRDFHSLVNRGGSIVSDHPADFDLFMVGKWQQLPDEKRPVLIQCDFEHIANGLDVVSKPEK